MPIQATMPDGSVRDIPTDEEMKVLQEQASKVDEEKKAREAAEAKAKELETQVNPNWQDARKQIDAKKKMEEQLKAQGKTIDAEGNITDLNPTQLSSEDIAKTASKAAREEILNAHKESLLSRYSADEKAAMEFYFNKFAAGETLDIAKVDKFMRDAEELVKPKQTIDSRRNVSGAPPRVRTGNEPTAEALEFAKALGNTAEDLARVNEPVIKL